ncbi:MAG: hypothetical protein [Caudoviricetes sp.]|nr:MAG: hypothetical protein [Caudoviricetes sp.]
MSATINVPVSIIAAAAHAMADKDIRYYLNGMMIEKSANGGVRVVATNGHHMIVIRSAKATIKQRVKSQYIIPRNMVDSIVKAGKKGGDVEFKISSNKSVSARIADVTFHDKLIDGRFPEWEKVIPQDDSLKGPVEVAPHYMESVIKAHIVLCKLEGYSHKYSGLTWHMRGSEEPVMAVLGGRIDDIEALAIVMPLRNKEIKSYREVKV